ncbi:hypothetical protein GCM10027074_53480 [Streptomyces deserti]
MTPGEMLAVFAAGVGAGAVNAVVGSGTLITFPVLLATDLPPVTATVSNALGVVPGRPRRTPARDPHVGASPQGTGR